MGEHERVLSAALAGLLHDVGKVEQRARVDPWKPAPGLGDTGQPVHATWSIYFAQNYVPQPYRAAALAGAYHHIPEKSPAEDRSLSELVELADKLSAGERANPPQDYPTGNPPQQMVTIFDQVQGRAGGYHYLPLMSLTLAESGKALFPAEAQSGEAQANAYEALRSELEQAAKQAFVDEATYLENLLCALQRLTWCVPSAYYHSVPDVSLYDHSRTTAALAACLTAFDEDEIRTRLEAVRRAFRGKTVSGDEALLGRPVALLVGGDISGIQAFIYTITSRGAASALRGRSLYLQLLTEAVARYVLRRLQLPVTNLLYAGGGHFFLLARHNDSTELVNIRREVSRVLLAFHSGDLYLALESVALAAQDFKGKILSQKWSDLSAGLRRAKTRKFSELEDDLHSLVFRLSRDKGNDQLECQVCGREHEKTEERDGVRKCPQCRDFEEWGKRLRAARHLRLSEVDFAVVSENVPPGRVEQALHCFGVMAQLDENIPAMPAEAQRSVIYALRDDALSGLKPDAHTAVGRRYFVNVTPAIVGAEELERLRQRGIRDLPEIHSVKPFEALEAESRGFKRLGVLRVDVDDMGKIVSEGLGELATLSRIATLSFMINLFFEGWAAELARKYNREGGANADRVYSIYSGGDDLFFVGAWDVMPALALDIRNDLRKLAGGHPGIHVSAGIALVGGRYPLYQAAEDAHEVLEAAKDRPGKNAISFLGQAVKWETFERVHSQMDKLRQLIADKSVPRALLQKLAQLHRLYVQKRDEQLKRGEGENRAGEEQVYWGPWNWRAAYFLSRLKVEGETAKQEVAHLRDQLSGENFCAIEWIGLAARWADLLTR